MIKTCCWRGRGRNEPSAALLETALELNLCLCMPASALSADSRSFDGALEELVPSLMRLGQATWTSNHASQVPKHEDNLEDVKPAARQSNKMQVPTRKPALAPTKR